MKQTFVPLVLLVTTLITSCKTPNKPYSVEEALRTGIIRGESPGACIAIYANGIETVYSEGWANIDQQRPIDGNTQFEIGSITKSFISLLVILAEEENLLSLDDPISDFFPESINIPEGNLKKIKIKNLLSHTSGLPLYPTNIDPGNEIQSLLTYSETNLADFFQNFTLPKEPGETYRYSSLGYGILGYILERLYKRSLNQLITERITKPLGMERTTINYEKHSDTNFADGYRKGEILNLYRDKSSISNGFGGLRSTACDLLIYMKAQAGMIQTPLHDSMKRTQEIQFKSGREMVCFGWFKIRDLLIYTGATRGFCSSVIVNLQNNKIFIMLINTQNEKWVTGVARKVMDY
jgi:CubicO group peptidase (beta-lactamase class C family)